MGEAVKTKKDKNRKKINVIDVVIILLVLALIGTVAYRIYDEINKNTSAKRSDYILTFECEVAYNNILKYLKAGDSVYLTSDGMLLGYIYDRPDDEKAAVYEQTEPEGDSADNTNNNKIKLKGTIILSNDVIKVQNSGYYTLGGRNITKGSALDIYTEKATLKITVKNIEVPAKQS